MLPDAAAAFLSVHAAGGCASVSETLVKVECSAADFEEWCKLPLFVDRLYSMFASLEQVPELDFMMPPPSPVACAVLGFTFAIDPYGPLHGSYAFDHVTRRFTDGKRMSELPPADVIWFNTAASW